MNESLFQEAFAKVQKRRLDAQLEQERRTIEISKAIPQIAEITRQLAQTSIRIMDVLQKGMDTDKQLEAIRQENLQAQSLCEKLLTDHGYPADYLKLHYSCPICNDTGYRQTEYCDCLKKEIASAAIARMNRKAQVNLSDFASFSLDYYKGRTIDGKDCYQAMRNIYQICVKYAENFSESSPSLLFYGKTGLGKTHLSLAIAREVLKTGKDVIYDSVINLFGQVEKEHFGRSNSEVDTLDMLLQVDLLILDDLGTEFDTAFNASLVYNIINTRLNRGLPTVISTNLDYQGIRNRYEDRIVSRLFAVYNCYEFIGTDVRILKKRENSPA